MTEGYNRIRELEKRLEALEGKGHQRTRDVIIGLPDALLARGVGAPRLILVSPNGTQYNVTVDDAGVISTAVV